MRQITLNKELKKKHNPSAPLFPIPAIQSITPEETSPQHNPARTDA